MAISSFGKRLKAIRESKNVTQIELAQKADIAVNSLRRYEAGKRQPTLGIIDKIASALEVDVNYLLGWKYKGVDEEGTEVYEAQDIETFLQGPLPLDGRITFNNQNKTLAIHFEDAKKETIEKYVVLINNFDQLNDEGQQEALKRIEELAELPRYKIVSEALPTITRLRRTTTKPQEPTEDKD